jgi:hypothetical protein
MVEFFCKYRIVCPEIVVSAPDTQDFNAGQWSGFEFRSLNSHILIFRIEGALNKPGKSSLVWSGQKNEPFSLLVMIVVDSCPLLSEMGWITGFVMR